mmetsp:Transcript_29419/g.57750  ORF Transcript_29419/g.57750 Transcript_29419/m.57750 type:complete len:93 (-) Transcript_29419:457-735(-)
MRCEDKERKLQGGGTVAERTRGGIQSFNRQIVSLTRRAGERARSSTPKETQKEEESTADTRAEGKERKGTKEEKRRKDSIEMVEGRRVCRIR